MRRRRALKCGFAAGSAALAGCTGLLGDRVSESFDDDYAVGQETVLAVENRNGDVTVEATDGDRIGVSGTKRASSQSALDTIDVAVRTGEQFVVEVTFGAGSDFSARAVDLTVTVPEGVTADQVRTANGDVRVADVAGDLEATSTNGSVEVRGVDGYVTAETSNGDVTVRNASGLDGARTTNGSVDVDLLAVRDDITCRTTNGDVTGRVGPDLSVAFRLETGNGEVSVRDLPHTVQTSRSGLLVGGIRDGTEPALRLESSNGDVTLRALES